VLANACLLLRTGLSGTSPALEVLVGGAALVGLAAAVLALVDTAATATGGLAIPGDAVERRHPPA